MYSGLDTVLPDAVRQVFAQAQQPGASQLSHTLDSLVCEISDEETSRHPDPSPGRSTKGHNVYRTGPSRSAPLHAGVPRIPRT